MLKISGKQINIIIHIFILSGLLAIFCLPFLGPTPWPVEFWRREAFFYLIYVGFYFINVYLLVPNLLFRNKTGQFLFVLFCIMVVTVTLNHVDIGFLSLPDSTQKNFLQKDIYYGKILADLGSLLISSFTLGLGAIITVAQRIELDVFEKQELEKEKISSELSFLKAQINPHFYFNVQHSIYALTASDIESAREAIYTLSHMMRYVLYETKNNRTTLFKELDFVESYIKLMKLRLTDNVQIIMDKSQHLNNVEIAPMLFLPFIENSFKHGISSIHPSYIYIGVLEMGDMLMIEVRNSQFENSSEMKEDSNGIGLVNTRRRLEILYPGKHTLNVIDDKAKKEFSINLKLMTK